MFPFYTGSFFLLPLLSSYFEIRDCLIGIFAILGYIAGSLTIAFAVSPLMIYLGNILKASSSITSNNTHFFHSLYR